MSGNSFGLHVREHTIPRLAPAGDDRGADLILRGGAVYRGTDHRGRPAFAEALAVRDGRIARVGDDRAVQALGGPSTVVLDLAGRTVVPGLIDSHIHLVRAGLTWTDEVLWYEIPSLERALAMIEAEAKQRPAGSWIRVVGGWHPGQFEEQRSPTSRELTRRFPDHPVYVQLLYEEAVLNNAALRACGITRGAPDPPGGTFERDPDSGEPTGTVRGPGAFAHCLARMPGGDEARGTREAMATLNRWGVTGAVDAGGLGVPPQKYESLFAVWREGRMTVRTRLYVCPLTAGREREEIEGWLRHARPGLGDGWLRHLGIGEIAVFGCHDMEGLTGFDVDQASRAELEHISAEVARRGWPLHLHAVLNDSASMVLDAWERVNRERPIGELRWSLAHVEPISDRNLDRVAALGCGIAVQNRMVYRAADSARLWGDEAVRGGPPLRAVLDRGIPLGAGTDATRVSSPNPWVSLWWLVTGQTFDGGPWRSERHRLTRAEALDAYSAGSAWFSFEEGERGSLEQGKLADLAVLNDDYFSVPADDVKSLAADLTLVDGRVMHAAGPFSGFG